MSNKDSPRQKLRRFMDSGELRYVLERKGVDEEVINLAVLVIDRYCSPRRRPRVVLAKGIK